MSEMADVLHVHTRRTGIRGMAIHCECGWSESILGMRSSKKAFAAHQAAFLSAAGFGPVQEARAEAWRTGYEQGWQDGQTAERTGEDFGPHRPNPYREDT